MKFIRLFTHFCFIHFLCNLLALNPVFGQDVIVATPSSGPVLGMIDEGKHRDSKSVYPYETVYFSSGGLIITLVYASPDVQMLMSGTNPSPTIGSGTPKGEQGMQDRPIQIHSFLVKYNPEGQGSSIQSALGETSFEIGANDVALGRSFEEVLEHPFPIFGPENKHPPGENIEDLIRLQPPFPFRKNTSPFEKPQMQLLVNPKLNTPISLIRVYSGKVEFVLARPSINQPNGALASQKVLSFPIMKSSFDMSFDISKDQKIYIMASGGGHLFHLSLVLKADGYDVVDLEIYKKNPSVFSKFLQLFDRSDNLIKRIGNFRDKEDGFEIDLVLKNDWEKTKTLKFEVKNEWFRMSFNQKLLSEVLIEPHTFLNFEYNEESEQKVPSGKKEIGSPKRPLFSFPKPILMNPMESEPSHRTLMDQATIEFISQLKKKSTLNLSEEEKFHALLCLFRYLFDNYTSENIVEIKPEMDIDKYLELVLENNDRVSSDDKLKEKFHRAGRILFWEMTRQLSDLSSRERVSSILVQLRNLYNFSYVRASGESLDRDSGKRDHDVIPQIAKDPAPLKSQGVQCSHLLHSSAL